VQFSVVPQVHSSTGVEPVDPDEDPDVELPDFPDEEGATSAEHPAAIMRERRARDDRVVRVIVAHPICKERATG
jgi:hypothetical protein